MKKTRNIFLSPDPLFQFLLNPSRFASLRFPTSISNNSIFSPKKRNFPNYETQYQFYSDMSDMSVSRRFAPSERERETSRGNKVFFIFKYLKSVEKWGQIATTQSRVAISVGPVAPVPIGHATSNRTIRQTQRYKTSQMISKTFLRVNTHTQSLYLGGCANAV